ncbi:MAG: N-carbamoylputrescine amidase, partial [Alphaproteobacteria bacterium]
MGKITVAAIQLAFSDDMARDIADTAGQVREAAAMGAQVVLPPELFQGHYFCRHERDANFARAYPLAEHPALRAMVALAAELDIAIPVSLFERDGPHY